MLWVNIDAEERSAESMEDMTAAAREQIPNKDTQDGVRYCSTRGRIFPTSPRSYGGGKPYSVWFQSDVQTDRQRMRLIQEDSLREWRG